MKGMNVLNDDFEIGDYVIVNSCIDDPVAEECLNDHAVIQELHIPYAKVQFLNGNIYNILIKNLKKMK